MHGYLISSVFATQFAIHLHRVTNTIRADFLITVAHVLEKNEDEILTMRHFGHKQLDDLVDSLMKIGFLPDRPHGPDDQGGPEKPQAPAFHAGPRRADLRPPSRRNRRLISTKSGCYRSPSRSRAMIVLRISVVPAPISSSLASRTMRPMGESFR